MLNYRFTPYSLALLVSATISLAVAVVVWRRRRAPRALWLFYFQLAAALWSFAGAFEAAAPTIALKILWSQISYPGINGAAFCFFLFAVEYGQQRRVFSERAVWILAILPVVTVVMVATNGWHHWHWSGVTLDPALNLAIYGRGPWFWVFVAYTYTLISIGVFQLALALFRLPARYRSQLRLLLIASVFPFAGNVIYLSGLNPVPGVDWTPIAFAITGALLVWGIFAQHILALMPVARTHLVESMMDGVLVVDSLHIIVDANPSAQALLEPAGPSLIGRPIHDVLEYWPDDSAWSGDETVSTDLTLREVPPLVVELNISPLHRRRRRTIGRLVVLRNITPRKLAEQALQTLNATLEEQVAARVGEIRAEKGKSETILQSVGDPIVLTDLELRVQYANPAFAVHSGYSTTDTRGQPVSGVAPWPDGDPARSSLETALRRGEMWQGEVGGRTRDGRPYVAALTVAPVGSGDGQRAGFVASYRDVTAQHELARAQRLFITNVSHEFRTPLTSIKLYLHLLRNGNQPGRSDEYLQVMAQQIDRLEHLVQDTLELATLDSEGVSSWEDVDLAAVTTDVLGRFQAKAEASGVILAGPSQPPHLPLVKGDRGRLTQALAELVENAILFTPAGGTVTVEQESVQEGCTGWAIIAVRDSGHGIPPDEHPRVFERFFRGAVAGAGLGLSITHEITRAHGGKVTVQSEPGRGSEFRMWLPGR